MFLFWRRHYFFGCLGCISCCLLLTTGLLQLQHSRLMPTALCYGVAPSVLSSRQRTATFNRHPIHYLNAKKLEDFEFDYGEWIHDYKDDDISSCYSCREQVQQQQQRKHNDKFSKHKEARGLNRRDFLAWGPISLGIASSSLLLDSPLPVAKSHAATLSDVGVTSALTSSSTSNTIPFSNTRQYKSLVLAPNGLRVLLVQDSRVLQAAAALSVGGAGQFAEKINSNNDESIAGLAHLCEHMVLSYASTDAERQRRRRGGRRARLRREEPSVAQDFEEWLSDQEGSSNAFTAYDNVCFHFTCPTIHFQEGLERFSSLFQQDVFEQTCRQPNVLQREIRRVDSELDYNDLGLQATSLVKTFVTPDHPYGRFSMGNIETLEEVPKVANIDVGERLIQFFRTKYLPSESILVVTAPQDLALLQKWVTPFSECLSRERLLPLAASSSTNTNKSKSQSQQQQMRQPISRRFYPGGFLQGSRLKQLVLWRKTNSGDSSSSSSNETMERLSFEWILNLDYTEAMRYGEVAVTGTQIAFCIAQILGRRGPESLYSFLDRRGWVVSGNAGVPRVTLPVDVSGFQVIKLDILLTPEGFLERSAVVAAVYDSLEALRRGSTYAVPRELVTQWASIAKLHGYLLTPRPPDAIELAQDVHTYGINGPNGVGTGSWYKFPQPDDRSAMNALQKSLSTALVLFSDPGNAVVIASASQKTLELAKLPPIESSRRWRTEPLTGGRFLYDDMLGLTSRLEELVLTRLVDREELVRPVLNPLVPIILKQPRPRSVSLAAADPRSTSDVLPRIARDGEEREFRVRSSSSLSIATSDRFDRKSWTLLEPAADQAGVPLPRAAFEPNYRSVFVLQLLSSRPARASLREAARGEIFKFSFEYALTDLAELGAPGGLAYDVSFNRYGMRIAFLGINQNLSSYARRFCRRLVEHPRNLLEGPEFLSSKITNAAVASARRARGFSQQRRSQIISAVRGSTAYEAAAEGNAFLRSCTGAVCFAEGDWSTTREVLNLQNELEKIFAPYLSPGRNSVPAIPSLDDLIYKPTWKPRFASPCTLAGVTLVSDACGRIPR